MAKPRELSTCISRFNYIFKINNYQIRTPTVFPWLKAWLQIKMFWTNALLSGAIFQICIENNTFKEHLSGINACWGVCDIYECTGLHSRKYGIPYIRYVEITALSCTHLMPITDMIFLNPHTRLEDWIIREKSNVTDIWRMKTPKFIQKMNVPFEHVP